MISMKFNKSFIILDINSSLNSSKLLREKKRDYFKQPKMLLYA